MKKLILACLVLSAVACKKKTTPTPTPTNPSPTTQTQYHDIPYWIDDTLVTLMGSTYDTVYAMTSSGKSLIKYKGVQYHVRGYVLQGDTFSDSSGFYMYDLYDMSGKPVNDTSTIQLQMGVRNSKYYDKSYNKWTDTRQSIGLPHNPPFPQGSTSYMSFN